MMKIRLSDITEQGLHIITSRGAEWLVNVPELAKGEGGASLSSDLSFDLRVSKVLKEVSVRGKVRFSVECPCARCLKNVDLILRPEVRLVLSPENVSRAKEEAENIHHETYSEDEIDLEDYLREVIAMSLPVKVLCREACEGLCTCCGANLNDVECSCREDWVNPTFAVLRNLKI